MLIFSQHLIKTMSKEDRNAILENIISKTWLENKTNQHYAVRKSNGLSFYRIDVYVNPDGLIMETERELGVAH
jgi:hypothetical protein